MQTRWVIPALAFGIMVCAVRLIAQYPTDDTASLLEQQVRTAEEVEAWKSSSLAHAKDPVPLAHLGLLEARQEHYAQSIAYYRKAIAIAPAMPGLRLNLGLAYFKEGEYRQAIDTFTPLLKGQSAESPEKQRLAILMGMSHYGLGCVPSIHPLSETGLGERSKQSASASNPCA